MSSKSEVGHKKNVANFSAAYIILVEMGALYNPTNTFIYLTNLAPINTLLSDVINQLDAAIAVYRADVADKNNAIKLMRKKCTKILNHFKSLNVSQNQIDNIRAQVINIRGDGKKAPKNLEHADKKTISKAQLSFDNRVANFKTLIAQLEEFHEYLPNEDEIKTDNLLAYTAQLLILRDKVQVSGDQLITARSARNNVLYFAVPNVLDLMRFVKSYVKSLGDPAKPYYKALVRLKFVNIKK